MFKLAIKIILVAALLLAVAGWLVLYSPFFEERRIKLVEATLSEKIGQRVDIIETVKLQLFPDIKINSGRMLIIGGLSEELPLAELPSASLDLDLKSFLRGQMEVTAIRAEGLVINLVTLEDGQTTWQDRSDSEEPRSDLMLDHKLVEYLLAREVQFTDFVLNISNDISGLDFSGAVSEFNVTQEGSDVASAFGAGTVNGLPFEISANYQGPSGMTLLTFGEVTVKFEGGLLPVGELGYEGLLTLEAASLDDFFELLRLDTNMQGTGGLTASIRRSSGEFRLSDITSRIDLSTGGWLSIEGDINDLRDMSGIDLKLNSHLEEAEFIDPLSFGQKQANLGTFSSEITGDARHIQLSNVEFQINSKDRGVESFGPFSVGGIKRMEDNTLSLEDLFWAVTTERGADLAFQADVRNLLELEDIRVEGRGRVSLAELIEESTELDVPDLGLAEFEVLVTDTKGVAALEKFTVQTSSDEVWDFAINATVDDLLAFDGVDYTFRILAETLTELQSAFGIEGELAGPFDLRGHVQRNDGELSAQAGLGLGASDASLAFSAQVEGPNPKVVGSLTSKVLNVEQVFDYVESFSKALGGAAAGMGNSDQPLKVGSGEETLTIPGQPKVQPLVLEDNGPPSDTRLRRIVGTTDINLTTSAERVVGLPGVRTIQSDLTVQEGVLRVSPLKLHLEGQSIQFDAEIDLLKTPELVRLVGNIFGWTLSDLMALLKWDVAAQGTLNTRFDMVGRFGSVDEFLTSANGSLLLRLKDGTLGTSLLKLASHGVFPWLFSQELSQGGSNVVCLVAPLRFSKGTVTLSDVTLETDSTQVVIDGSIDLRADKVNVTGEPRPLGMPFEPSPYPFRASGDLEDPEFTLLPTIKRVGDKRLRIVNRQPCRPDRKQVKGR